MTGFLPPRARLAFVPYALADHDAYTARVRAALAGAGIEVRGVHEGGDPVARLGEADAVFVGGGNSFRLLDALYRTGLREALIGAAGDGLPYMGASAGTNMAAPSLRTTNDMPIVQPPSFEALGLVPFQINPHYLDPDPDSTHKGETREERLAEFLEENDVPVLGLRRVPGCGWRTAGRCWAVSGTPGCSAGGRRRGSWRRARTCPNCSPCAGGSTYGASNRLRRPGGPPVRGTAGGRLGPTAPPPGCLGHDDLAARAAGQRVAGLPGDPEALTLVQRDGRRVVRADGQPQGVRSRPPGPPLDLLDQACADPAAAGGGADPQRDQLRRTGPSAGDPLAIPAGRPSRRATTWYEPGIDRRARHRSSRSPAPCHWARVDPKAWGASARAASRSARHSRQPSGPTACVSIMPTSMRRRVTAAPAVFPAPGGFAQPTGGISVSRESRPGRALRQAPRVKSGTSTGPPFFSRDMTLNGTGAHQAAES